MLIGILSDSHGRADTTRRAVRTLTQRGAELLLHLGDIGADAVLEELVGPKARIVFGNCDADEAALARYADLLGIAVDHPAGRLVIDGKILVFTHGHLHRPMDEALAQGVHYLLHGHTHEVRDERHGPTRIINPGALCRARRYTAALLDPAADRLEILDLGRP